MNLIVTKNQIAIKIKEIYNDYQKDGVIFTLSKYEDQYMTRTYLRKLADIGIIKRLTLSKKNMQYEWNEGNNPNFIELTNRLFTSKTVIKEINSNKNYNLNSSKITLLLVKYGINEEKIPDLTFQIMKIFYSE
jgi:hypothetical protein